MTTATAPCFGKLFDANETDCAQCQMNADCAKAVGQTAPAIETAPVTEADLEAKATEAMASVEEAAAAKAAAEELVADKTPAPKKRGRKPKAKEESPAPVAAGEGTTTRERTARKAAAFKKDDKGKLVFTTETAGADLIVNTGDIVKINNARSKYNGQQFVILSYSEKYECLRASQPTTKINADFLPGQIEVVQRAEAATA